MRANIGNFVVTLRNREGEGEGKERDWSFWWHNLRTWITNTYSYQLIMSYSTVVGWIVFLKKDTWSPKPQDLRMGSYLEKGPLQRWSHAAAGWAPNPNDCALMRRWSCKTETRGEFCGIGWRMGVWPLQAMECRRLPTNYKKWGK